MPLLASFHVDRVRLGLRARSKDEVLAEMAELLCVGSELQAGAVLRVLAEREAIASTAVGSGVAIPHGRLPALGEVRGALGIHAEGVPFEAVDGRPVRIVVALLAPEERPADHLKALARVSRRLRQAEVRSRLLSAATAEQALAALLGEAEERAAREP